MSMDIPFAQARSMSVSLDNVPDAKADCFIDDIITAAVDNVNNLDRIEVAHCTVIREIAHNVKGKTYVPCQNIILDEKNEVEGAPEEKKICLGWLLNTRQLLISLPTHTYNAWDDQIASIIKQKSIKYEDLESILGRLENFAIILVMLDHF